MSGSFAMRVIVVGAGAFGSSIALVLAQAGARVRLVDSAPMGDNASGVAAGMLAPAFEALLDPPAGQAPSATHFSLLREARDLWPSFLERLNGAPIGLERCGALWIGQADAPNLDARLDGLIRLGARARPLTAARVSAVSPHLAAGAGGGVFTPEDWRLDPGAALNAIARAGEAAGVEPMSGRVVAIEVGVAILDDGRRLEADTVVLATGADDPALAPELACLSPIKGHILRYPVLGAVSGQPVVRCRDGYGVVGEGGVHIGATMQPGQGDRRIEPDAVAGLRRLAIGLFPALGEATPRAAAAVRAATPDGLPLVGPSAASGVILAVGARRNGWLLAPLVAAMAAAYVTGADPGSRRQAFDARRFG